MMSYVGEPLSPGAPPSYDDPAPVDEIRVGWLYKRSRLGLCWNRRWVSAADGQLTTHADASSPTKLTVTLAYATVQLLSSSRDRYRFEVGTALGARFEFAAETSRDANDWVRFLRSQIGPQPRRRARDRNADQQQQQTQLAPPPQHDDNEAVGEPGRPGASPAIPWNDMYQSIVEMSESTFNQSVEKARRLNGLVDAFVRCARRVARVIVDEYTLPPHLKTIAPIDRIDAAPEDETFTSDGIAFTFMHEQNGSEAQDELQRKMGTHDLHGTTAYANVPATSSDLHTHLCCVVDYLGFRLFCLALVPIYDDTRVTFGRVGGALQREARTEALLEAAARDLHLATHDAFVEEGAQGETVAIHAASSVMVHRGEDQRLYVTNLTRAFPVDRNRDGTDPAGVGQLRPEFLRLYAKALSPDAFLVGGTADADGNDDDVAQACRYLRDTVVGEFVKQMDLLALVPVDSAHLTALMHDRGINARYLGAIADTTALPHVREMAVCEMVARTCKAVLQRSWRRRARSARASAGRRPDHPRLHDDDAKLDQALRQAARQQAGAQRDAAVDLFNAVLGHDADFWRRCIAERLARKFAYAISAEESRALHRPLLLAALQHHCGVRLVDAGARRTGPPAPLTRQQVVAIDARCKWPTISSLRCHLFPKKADQYLRDGAFDMAVQALRLRLDVMVGAGDDDLGGSAPQTPTSASSSSLPPAPPPPHRKGGGSTGPVPGAGAADLSQGGGGGGDNDDNGWSASGAEAHRTLNDLCEAYLCQGDVGEARRAAQRALRLSAGADARTCQTYALLVGVYGALGESGRAQQALHLALSMTRHLYGPHHPLLLRLLDEAGTRALQAGDAADAEQRYRAAIDLALTSLGKSHPTTATFYTRVGNVLHLGGHLDKAKDAHEKACLIYEGLYGPASIDVARSCFYLSDILARKGDHQTARYYNQRALKIRQQLLGDEAPDTLDSFHQVAWQAHHREDHDEAIPYFEALLARYKAMPAPTDAALADIRRMTKAVIRLAMRALPMDQVAFLDRVYQESRARGSDNAVLTRSVIRKLYHESPSAYIGALLKCTSRGVAEPGYAEGVAELAVVLSLMESSSSDSDNDDDDDDGDGQEGATRKPTGDVEGEQDDDDDVDASALSYAIGRGRQASPVKAMQYAVGGTRPNTIVRS